MAKKDQNSGIVASTRAAVQEAREAVGKLRDADDLTSKQMNLLDTTYVALGNADDLLAVDELGASVKKLQAHAEKLATVNANLKKSVEKLKKVAKYVDKAAKAIGVLADVLAKASSVGIL